MSSWTNFGRLTSYKALRMTFISSSSSGWATLILPAATYSKFHQHFMRAFFVRKQIAQLFSNYRSAFRLFGKRILAKERVHKMLMKLTPYVTNLLFYYYFVILNFFCRNENLSLWCRTFFGTLYQVKNYFHVKLDVLHFIRNKNQFLLVWNYYFGIHIINGLENKHISNLPEQLWQPGDRNRSEADTRAAPSKADKFRQFFSPEIIFYLLSISSTFYARIFCTKVFSLLRVWLWTNFFWKTRAQNVDEIDGLYFNYFHVK